MKIKQKKKFLRAVDGRLGHPQINERPRSSPWDEELLDKVKSLKKSV